MNNLSKNFKSLPEIDFPEGLHGKIMKKLFYNKLKTPAVVIAGLLALNFIASTWRLWIRMTEFNTLTIISSLFDSFELRYEYFADFFHTIFEFTPFFTVFMILVDVVAFIYLYRSWFDFQSLAANQQMVNKKVELN
jgi:hypothetical protein